MMRLATEADIQEMKVIWDDSFHDSVNYIDFVFDRVAGLHEALIYEDMNEVAAMLLMIPVRFSCAGESVKAMYIFGAATKVKFRNKGYMTRLIEEAERIAREERGTQLSVLVPAERYLFDYYKKRGYHADFSLRVVKVIPELLETAARDDFTVNIDKITSSELYKIREQALAETAHIEWQPEQIPFVIDDSLIYGDHVADYSSDTVGKAYAVFSNTGRKLYIKECLGTSDTAAVTLIRNLGAQLHPKTIMVNLPVASSVFACEGDVKSYGMAKPLIKDSTPMSSLDPYMNLMLD